MMGVDIEKGPYGLTSLTFIESTLFFSASACQKQSPLGQPCLNSDEAETGWLRADTFFRLCTGMLSSFHLCFSFTWLNLSDEIALWQ